MCICFVLGTLKGIRDPIVQKTGNHGTRSMFSEKNRYRPNNHIIIDNN